MAFHPEDRVRVTLTGNYPFGAVSFDHVDGTVTAQGVVLTGADANRVREQVPSRPVEPEDICFDVVESHTGAEEASTFEVGEHTGAGWYVLLRGGEPVVEDGETVTVGRGKEKAQAQIDEMNAG